MCWPGWYFRERRELAIAMLMERRFVRGIRVIVAEVFVWERLR